MAEKERQSASRESKATGSSSPAATESLTVLSREERLACWDSRDAYYHCKATHGPEACTAERAAFERLCPAAWVGWERLDQARASWSCIRDETASVNALKSWIEGSALASKSTTLWVLLWLPCGDICVSLV